MEKVKQNLSTIVIFALAICLVFAFAFTMNSAVVYADDTLEGEKVADIKIGQMSDIHYFPLEYCYQNIAAENFYSSDYYNSLTGDTKLVAESGAILTANIKRIIEDAKVGKAPLYMFISGDNTKNGERVAEIDVANGLRYMQNKIRSFGVVNGIDYANFQVFATVGNHDLYNGDGALYDKATGDAWNAEGIDTAQFALIYAGLGYPDASLDGSVGVKLTDFFSEDYWSSSFTNGYVQSSNSPSVSINYFNQHLQNVANGIGNAVEEYAQIGDGLNQLTFGAKILNSGYNFFAFDTTDRVEAEKLIPIEIWKEQYDVLKVDASRTFYVSSDRKEFTKATDTDIQDAFSTGKHVYVAALYDHLCGGRITLETFGWIENYLKTISSNDELSTLSNLATFHHNIVPHFTQEDDILKDFTLYNWEYDAKRFIELGIRFTFAGHQHASDIEMYTDAEGRSITEFETGSGVSNDSPVRYFTISRYNVDGRLAETAASELYLLHDFKGMPSDKITTYLDAHFDGAPYEFDESAFLPLNEIYQAAVTAYKNASAAEKEAKHAELQTALDNLLAANPDFYVQSMHYYELYDLELTYNEYIYQEIYGQLVDRILDHFLGDGTGLFETVMGLVDSYLKPGNSVLDTLLGGILKQYSGVVYKMAVYIVNAVWYQLYPDNDGNGYGDYVYDGVAYDNVIVFAKAVANKIVNLEFGTEEAGGKLTLAKMASAVLLTSCNGNEPYSNLTLKGISSFEDDFWYQDGTMYDEAFRVRYLAAMKDFAEQCDSGKLVDTLLNTLLTPIFYDENSLLKALLNYKFDFTSDYCKEVSGMTDADIKKIASYKEIDGEMIMTSGLFYTLNGLLQDMFGAEELDLTEKSLVLREVINGAMSLVSNLLDSLLGFSISGDDVIGIVQGFIDDYLTDSFCVGLGGIAKNIVIAFGTDDSTDIANLKDPSEPYELEPCENFALIKDKDTQVVKKAFFLEGKAVGAEQNPATFENNRLPGTMTANFDTKNSTTEFTLSFYTDEEIFAKIQYRKVGDTEWTTASGDHWNIFDEAERETKYATSGIYKDNLFGDVTVGNVNIKTITAPAYIPLIDLGILCITHGQVDYEDADGNTVYYTCRDRDNTPSNTIIFRNRHIVTISGLEANTTYEYNVFGEYYATDGTLKASYSLAGSQGVDHFTFKTAADKSTRTFDFLAIADMQGMIQSMYDESANDIAKITDKFGYDFVLNAGDMTDNGKNYYHWQYALNTNVNFFANTSAFNAAGNHEANTYAISNFYNYTQPDSVEFNAIGKAEQDYYSFDYGCAHITVLDTNDASKDGLGATQLEWLKQDLEANKDAEVKFVLMHKSLYSTGSHTMDNDVVAMRAQLVPLFKQYAIDIVFGGHDHVYCEAEVDGTLYVTLGTIGTKFYEYTNDSEEVAAKLNENSINHTLTQRTFGYVKVEDGKVTYQGYTFDENGEIIGIKPEANGKDGLPAWAIALIVVGSVAVAAGIGVGVFFIIKKKKAK